MPLFVRILSLLSLSVLSPLVLLPVSLVRAAEVPGVTDKEIKFGNHSLQSGAYAAYGVAQRVAKAYFEKINDEGGIYGRKINYTIGDNAGNPQQALQVMKKQVEEDGIFAAVGDHSFPHVAVYQYLRQKGVPDLWVTDAFPGYTNPVNHFTFQFPMSATDEGTFLGKYIAKHWPGKTVGVLYWNNVNGKKSVEAFEKAVDGKVKLVMQETDPKMDPASKSQILSLQKAKVDVIFAYVLMPVTPAAMKFAHERGFKPQWVLASFNRVTTLVDLAGKDVAEGAIAVTNNFYNETDTEIAGIRKHLEFMKEKLPNEKPSFSSVAGQVLGEATVETLRKAGKDLTRESLIKGAESFKDWKCSVCIVPVTTSPEQHGLTIPTLVYRMHDGKWALYAD